MKLEDSVEIIRTMIFNACDKRLSQLGLLQNKQYEIAKVPQELQPERGRADDILNNLIGETGDYTSAREKLIDELSFTLFNRIASVKVIEAHQLIPEVFSRRESLGGKSFGHKLWLEQNPESAGLKIEGLREYIRHAFAGLSKNVQLYSPDYLYDMLPDVFDLNAIIEEFNRIEENDWKSDDIMGWMYEYYNRKRRKSFKTGGEKIEYQWVSLTSQIYTPRWVVEFILNNSLGKLWMEMHPESCLKDNHDIANVPEKPEREIKPLEEINVLDPAVGSGNFLLYAFDLLYEMYLEQGYDENDIPRLIIENNLHGIDLDDRAVQIAQLGLYIKAIKRNKDARISRMNVVSTDFYLPEYEEIGDFFKGLQLHDDARELLKFIWDDLRMAHKFGSLIRIEERLYSVIERYKLKDQRELFEIKEEDLLEQWEITIIPKIKEAIEKYTTNGNGKSTFFQTKTLDSMTFVGILQNKFDVVVANPPYTDSANYGPEIKNFMMANYKKPLGFHNNLYGAFLKRGTELILPEGKIGYINPPTFMYIKTFEDMRKYITNNFHIHIFVEWGYLGIFSPTARVDSAIYILENKQHTDHSIFIKLNDLYETKRKDALFKAYRCYLNGANHPLLHRFDQSKLKQIKSWPFIYWISDEFREKFGEKSLEDVAAVKVGINTGGNEKSLRFWWEIDKKLISVDYCSDRKKWVPYSKGGPYEKWFGNLWLNVNWANNGNELVKSGKSVLRNKSYYFKKGITYSASGSKGVSFRLLPSNHIFDVGGSCIFQEDSFKNISYLLALMNSKVTFYLVKCLNPTVNTQVGDLQRIPFAYPPKELEDKVSLLAEENVNIKKHLCEFSIIEMNYIHHPLMWAKEKNGTSDLRTLIKTCLDYENKQLAQLYLNEAIIDELIFEVYQLSDNDRQMVLDKEGIPIGSFPVISGYDHLNGEHPAFVKDYFNKLEIKKLLETELQSLTKKIEELYKQNHTIEEISKHTGIHPVSITSILGKSTVLPAKRMNDIAKDFLFDMVREMLQEDDDGIIPLVGDTGEVTLQNRLFDKLVEKDFSAAQIGNYRDVLGKDINDYLEKNFFADLCDRLNLFMYLPQTPFIWHLSAGEHGSFDAFVSIYKWSRDNMLRLRSVYVEKRESSLKNRLVDLERDDSIKAQNEKEIIGKQLFEIEEFKAAIDDILKSGYDPKLDNGVGKNIAPLQEKGLLKTDVLKKKELEKYLNADW